MKTDRLKRRLRNAPPQPVDAFIGLTERDLLIFEVLHRHGPLPSHYLYEFTKHIGRDFTALKHRLTQLYNGSKDSTKYLTRPPQQFASFMARYQYLIHDLAPPARQILAEQGRLSRFIPPRTDHFMHRFMGACVSASLELGVSKAGHRYIARHEILSRSSWPVSTRQNSNPLALPVANTLGTNAIVPDELFGIDYGGRYRFFALEIDRNTESIERSNLAQTSFGRKVLAYTEVMKNRTFKQVWRVPNLLVLTVSANQTHLGSMMSYVTKVGSEYADRFLFRTKYEFGANWCIPPIMYDLYEKPWAYRNECGFSIAKP